MNKANWVLFFILNILLTSSISNYYVSSCNSLNIALWNSIGKLLLWLLLSLPVQFVIFPILYEFLNRKSPIFLFLNKLRKLNFSLTVFASALGVDALSFLFFYKFYLNNIYLLIIDICYGGLLASYLGLFVWLKLRKYRLYKKRCIIKSIGKWLGKRKFVNLKNIVVFLNVIFVVELTKIGFAVNGICSLIFLLFLIIPLVFIEFISVLSYVKKQKAQPFQRGVIFIISLLIFIYTQLAISILFLVNLI